MPTFEFTSPEGLTFEVGGPEGSTPEQAFGVIKDIPALASAITHVESGGNPDAVSTQGATGSMQIMKPTFDQYAVPGQDDFGNDKHRRAAAMRKIVDDYQHFGGDVAKTAAAYIGGRGAVRADGTIRDDVADANGTTPAAYAQMIMGRMGVRPQAQGGGAGRGKVNPAPVDPTAPVSAGVPARASTPDTEPFDPMSSGGPEIAQALQDQAPKAGGGRGFVNPPAIGEPTKDVGVPESALRGWVGAGGTAARAVALVPGLLGVAVDSVTNAITGGDSTTAQDAMFRQLVDPAQRAIDWAALKPDEKQGTLAKIAQGIGAMVQDLPQMFASGGLKVEQAAVEAAPTVARFLEQAVGRGFDAMRPIMVKAGTERAQQVLDNGGTIQQAVVAATTDAIATGMQGAQPMSAEGGIIRRAATGLPVGAVQSEANRSIANAAAPENMQQPFSPENMVVGAVTNAAAAGAMGHAGGGRAPDRIDLGYEPTTRRTPVAAAVQGMGEQMEHPGPTGAEPARDHVADIFTAGSVEDAAQAALKVATEGGKTDLAAEIRAIRPVAPVDLSEGSADGADAEVPPVPAGAGGPGGADAGAGLDVRVGGDGADLRAVEPTGDAGEAPAGAAPLGAERGADAVGTDRNGEFINRPDGGRVRVWAHQRGSNVLDPRADVGAILYEVRGSADDQNPLLMVVDKTGRLVPAKNVLTGNESNGTAWVPPTPEAGRTVSDLLKRRALTEIGSAERAALDTQIKDVVAGGADAVAPELTGNPFRTFLMRNGVALHLAKDFAPGTKERLAMGRTFRGNGLELDALAERAAEQGFIRSPDDIDHLYDLIGRAVSGERVGPQFGADADAEMQVRMERQRQQEHEDAERKWELSHADLEETGFAQADPELQARVHELMAQAEAAGVDHESVLEDAARITQNGTQHDYLQAAQGALEAAVARARGAGDENRGSHPREAGAEPGSQEAPGLTSPTPDDVVAQQRRREQGERELAQRRAEEEARARADADLPDFGLTGSDRPADANPDQDPLFSRTKRPYEVERTPSGSLIARGDHATIREALGNLPPDALVPTKDGIQVAKNFSDRGAQLLQDFDPTAHADLNGKKVSIKVEAEDGTQATLKLDAGRALRAADARERELERLRECVGRAG